MAEQPAAYRAPMRSPRSDDGAAARHAIDHGVVGIDAPLPVPPEDLAEAVAAVTAEHGDRTAARLRRFAETPAGAYVWTRDAEERVWLGRLIGPWHYDAGTRAAELGLMHRRDCRWLDHPVDPAMVPEPVRATFARGGRNWQRIGTPGAGRQSRDVWSRLSEE